MTFSAKKDSSVSSNSSVHIHLRERYTMYTVIFKIVHETVQYAMTHASCEVMCCIIWHLYSNFV